MPALATQVVDRVGAGDAVLCLTALCVAQKAPPEIVGFIGNVVGAEAVKILGNQSSIERIPLYRHIECLLKMHRTEQRQGNYQVRCLKPSIPQGRRTLCQSTSTVLVTGGAGYVGSCLTPKLLAPAIASRFSICMPSATTCWRPQKDHPRLEEIKGDMRDEAVLDRCLRGCDAVIHLACISNDPSFELDPTLGKSINYDCFFPLVDLAQKHGVRRFIYASSSSVYGIKDVPDVTEDLPLDPLTDYSKYKAMCEEVLLAKARPGFTALILRPATVCGYSTAPAARFVGEHPQQSGFSQSQDHRVRRLAKAAQLCTSKT